jgi:hypothetical protein
VSRYGYKRIAEREIPAAMARISGAEAKTFEAEVGRAMNLVRYGVKREIGALRSMDEISTGSPAAKASVSRRVGEWEVYGASLNALVNGTAAARARALGVRFSPGRPPDPLRPKYAKVVPAISPAAKGKEFNLGRFSPYQQYLKDHPDALKGIALNPGQTSSLLNFVNGRNSVADIRDDAAAELDADLPLQAVAAYLELLAAAGYVVLGK